MNIEITAFLDRRNRTKKSSIIVDVPPKWIKPLVISETKLTNKFKYSVASELVSAIGVGHDTFGKLFKKFKYTKREFRAGIRFGKSNWIVRPKVVVRGRTRQLTTNQAMIVMKSRFYEVVDY